MRHAALTATVLALLLGGSAAASAQEDVIIGALRLSHLWVPATPETAKDAPGYLTITNTGQVADRLVGGSFVQSAHLQVHTSSGKGAAAKMAPVEGGIVIDPGETVTLKPGGPHLMFVGLRSPLKQGSSEQAILQFEKAGSKYVDFAVEGAPPKAARAKR